MPSRPIQHQVELQTRLAFQQALPPEWVCRDEKPDYGIDASVEIFEDERSTSRRFLVQLKGTSKLGNRTVRLSRENTRHYLSGDLPVLLVLYVVPEDTIYARWIYQFDPSEGGWGETNVRLKMTEKDRWTADTPEALASDVFHHWQLQKRLISRPLHLAIEFHDDRICDMPAAHIRLVVRRAMSNVSGVVQLSQTDEKPIVQIHLSQEKIRARVAGRYTAICSLQNRTVDEDTLVSAFFVTLGVALAKARLPTLAAPLFERFRETSGLLNHPEIAVPVVSTLLETGRISSALLVWEEIERESTASTILQIIFGARATHNRDLAENLDARLNERASDIPKASKGATAYNYGNFLRYHGRFRESFVWLRCAAQREPDYWRRPYFLREIAGVLYETRRYRLSSTMYKCALDEEDRAEWYALYADALAHSGQYAEALDALRTYFDNIEHPEPYWWLFQAVLDLIVEKFSIDTQIRDRETAINIASPGQYSADELQQPETFATALKHDALCGLAWFNMGIAYTEGDEHEQATYAFIGAAISVSWDEEAWVNALGASINANPYLAAIVLQSAHSVLGTDVVIGFIEALQESAPDQIDDLMPLLDQVIQSIPVDSQKGTFTYRLRHADGSVEKETLHF